jgi:uncharacterized protein YuzB (UPF0349 family)
MCEQTEKEPNVPVVEYDSGELPCQLLAQYWYALLNGYAP